MHTSSVSHQSDLQNHRFFFFLPVIFRKSKKDDVTSCFVGILHRGERTKGDFLFF